MRAAACEWCVRARALTRPLPRHAAGQVVMHAHFHVIPRTDGDGVVRLGAHGGSGTMIDPADAPAIGDAIRAAL